jgi:hypothetical protein
MSVPSSRTPVAVVVEGAGVTSVARAAVVVEGLLSLMLIGVINIAVVIKIITC